MLNKVTLIGRLGQDPEVKNTQGGKRMANLSIATSEKWRDRNSGEMRERVEWHRVVIFNEGLAGVAEKYLHKGSLVYVEGTLQTRKWQDQSGADRYTTEVVLGPYNSVLTMLGGKGDQNSGPRDDYEGPGADSAPSSGGGGGSDLDDEIPF